VSVSGTLAVTAVLLSEYFESGGEVLGFDARTVHPALVSLLVRAGPAGSGQWVAVTQRGGVHSTFQRDVDGDGDIDVGFSFTMADLRRAGLTTASVLDLGVRYPLPDGTRVPRIVARDPSPPRFVP
jgi:hypothetical protein